MSNSCLFILTCGRKEYIQETVKSWEENLQNFEGKKIIFDDSGNAEVRQWLKDFYGDRYELITFDDNNIGLYAMMQNIINFFSKQNYEDVLMLEEDWLLEQPIDFKEMQKILNLEQTMQVRVTVASWHSGDVENNGRIGFQKTEATFIEKEDYVIFYNDAKQYFWSNNPSVFKSSVFTQGMKFEDEDRFGDSLRERYKTFIYYPKYPVAKHIGYKSSLGNEIYRHGYGNE